MRAPVIGLVAAIIFAVAIVVLVSDEGSPGPDTDRYCELAAELDESADELAAELSLNLAPSPEDRQQAELDLLEENVELISELLEVAPEEIADEVRLSVEAVRVRAGLSAAEIQRQELADAEAAIQQFKEENCAE